MLDEGIKFTVCWLVELDGDCPTLDFLVSLIGTDKDCFYSVIDCIEKIQDQRYLKEPLVKSLKGKKVKGILELRVLGGTSRHYARLPLVYSPNREVILLFGEVKKQKEPSQSFINRSISYRNKVNNKETSYEPINIKEIRELAQR